MCSVTLLTSCLNIHKWAALLKLETSGSVVSKLHSRHKNGGCQLAAKMAAGHASREPNQMFALFDAIANNHMHRSRGLRDMLKCTAMPEAALQRARKCTTLLFIGPRNPFRPAHSSVCLRFEASRQPVIIYVHTSSRCLASLTFREPLDGRTWQSVSKNSTSWTSEIREACERLRSDNLTAVEV